MIHIPSINMIYHLIICKKKKKKKGCVQILSFICSGLKIVLVKTLKYFLYSTVLEKKRKFSLH